MSEKTIIVDLENQNISNCLHEAFLQAGILPMIEQIREIYVHVPLGATFFKDGNPIGGTYLDIEFAKALISICEGKPVTFYEAPATSNRNIKGLFEKLGYTELVKKYSQVQILCLEEDQNSITLNYGFEYPPVKLPAFLFDKNNLIISFGNPKSPFSEVVAGFKGLPFSLSGKSLIIGSTLFPKKNLLHLAFSDIGLGLKGYVIDALDRIHKEGVICVGINGGRFAGAMIDQVKLNPVDWNVLVVSTNIGLADSVTAGLMGFDPQNVEFFIDLIKKELIPSDLKAISVVEIGNSRERLSQQLKDSNPFLPKGTAITTRQWIFGLLKQVSFKNRVQLMGRMIPSIIRYQFKKKKKKV
jgi:hypothetical protein